MPTQIETYILDLARDYLFYCDTMQSPDCDPDIRRELSSQRTWIHNELIRVLGDAYARPYDMRAYCRQLLNDA
jgi:hypothetical protein